MRKAIQGLLVGGATLATLSAASAAVTFEKAKCPAAADATFKIVGALGETDGVDAEYDWLAAQRPGWQGNNQSTLPGEGGRIYDLLEISKGAQKQVICFDITDFYGK